VGAGTVVATLAVGSALLLLGGFNPVQAFGALVSGAFGSPDRFLSITLVRAVPLTLTGLAVALAFRAGVWNIGAEGQFYAGAAAATWVGLQPFTLPVVPGVLVAMGAAGVAGAGWALLPALMRSRLGVGEVITTILMNFVAINLVGWLVNGPLQETRSVFPQSDSVAAWARLPALFPGTRLHWGFVLALILTFGMALWWRFAPSGFRVRATGLAPAAASVSGRISTGKLQFRVFLISGALAGLAGDLSPGYGYTAIAVALLGGLRPFGVLLAAVLIGGLEGGAGAMQRDAGIPAVWVVAIEAVVILAVLALEGLRRRANA
jgi:simple sugar transport system permease protein